MRCIIFYLTFQPVFSTFLMETRPQSLSGRMTMQTYVLLTKLSPDLSKQVKDRATIGRAWLDQVQSKCPEVQFLSHYALLGDYDFIDIYEAPDEETAAKVSLISLSNGAYQAKSLIAIPYKKFLTLTKEI